MLRKNRDYRLPPYLILIILFFVFASRVQFLTDTPFSQDEARSGMRMMGTPAEVIAWQPPDWPPLHNLLLGTWSSLTGEFPFNLRVFSAFFSLISVCIAYQMAYQLTKDRQVAWGTLVFYAGLGLSVYLGVFIRGYMIVLALFPLAIWLTSRYFDTHRKWDMVWLAITLGAMFITTYTSVFAFLFLGLYTLLNYPRQIWRWIPIGVIASPFALIELLRKWNYWIHRVGSDNFTGGFTYDIEHVFTVHVQDYFGQAEPFWIILVIVSCVLFLWKGRHQFRLFLWVIIGCLLAPIITFWLVESHIYIVMTSRYSWWAIIMLAFGLSLGLRYLPRIVWLGVLLIILGLMFMLPMHTQYYTEDAFTYHYEDNMEWLSQQVQSGDVLLFDPNYCIKQCFDQDTLAYFWDVYLGDTVTQIDNLGEHRRMWLWRGIGHSRELLKELSKTTLASVFYGPPIALLELYVAPPNPEGILFDNGMRFHGFDVLHEDGQYDVPPYNLREQTTLNVRLWWSADRLLDEDYQVSIQVHDTVKNRLFTQDDNSPQLIHLKPTAFEPLPKRTSQWIPHQLYVEERILEFPNANKEIYADINLIVYRLADGTRITGPGITTDGLFPLTKAIVWAWG